MPYRLRLRRLRRRWQALGIVKEKAALGSEREKLLTQFESMSVEQQQAMMQVRGRQYHTRTHTHTHA